MKLLLGIVSMGKFLELNWPLRVVAILCALVMAELILRAASVIL